MAMWIGKFHKLIQSKLLWILFLGVIVITFVFWGTQLPDDMPTDEELSAGTIYGELIPNEVFRQAYFNTYLSISMALGRRINISDTIDEQLRAAAWRRLIDLKQAEDLGITVSDREIVQTIQQHPGFSQNGQFNRQAYAAFVQGFLNPSGISESQFEFHVREEVMMQKLRFMVNQAVLISPYELKRTFGSISDSFEIEIVKLTPDDVTDTPELTEEKIAEFFEERAQDFETSEQVRVKYMAFDIADFVEEMSDTVTEEDAKLYYDENIEDYLLASEEDDAEVSENDEGASEDIAAKEPAESEEVALEIDGVTEAVEDEPDLADVDNDATDVEMISDTDISFQSDIDFLSTETSEPEYQSFEEVKDAILEKLIWEQATLKAMDVATDAVIELTPDRNGNAPTFEEVAIARGLEVFSTEPFALESEVPGVAAGVEFNMAAFRLEDDPEAYFSDPVVGEDKVYALALIERIPPRIPELDEVIDEVTEAALEVTGIEALAAKAVQFRDEAEKAIDEGRTFSEVAKDHNLEVTRTDEFTAAVGLEDNENSEEILRAILARNEGEISDIIPATDGVLISYVAKRTPGDATTYDALKQQIRTSIKRERSRLLFEDWEDANFVEASLEERKLPEAEEDEEELEEDEEVEDGEENAS